MSTQAVADRAITLSIDCGGTDLKAVALDSAGEQLGELQKIPTPQPPDPAPVIDGFCALAKKVDRYDRVSVGFPGVVRDGVIYTAENMGPTWLEFDLATELSQRLGVPVRVANDADIQGFGAIEGRGVELVITLGTGIGTALFVDGKLVPNLELGHHSMDPEGSYEQRLGLPALRAQGEEPWKQVLQKAIRQWRRCFSFRQLYLGGGNSRLVDFPLEADTVCVDNRAGVLGGIALWRDVDHPHAS